VVRAAAACVRRSCWLGAAEQGELSLARGVVHEVCRLLDRGAADSSSEADQLRAVHAARGCVRLARHLFPLRQAVSRAAPLLLLRLQRLRGPPSAPGAHTPGALTPCVVSGAGRAVQELGRVVPRTLLCRLAGVWARGASDARRPASSGAEAAPAVPESVGPWLRAASASIDADVASCLALPASGEPRSGAALSSWRALVKRGLAADAPPSERLLDALAHALAHALAPGAPSTDALVPAVAGLALADAGLDLDATDLDLDGSDLDLPDLDSPGAPDSDDAGLAEAARCALWLLPAALSPSPALARQLDDWVEGVATHDLASAVAAWRARSLSLLALAPPLFAWADLDGGGAPGPAMAHAGLVVEWLVRIAELAPGDAYIYI